MSKSTNKITQSLSDFVTKRKLDDEALEALEEALLTADLGPKTAATIIEEFAKTRFGKEADDQEIREALAEIITDMLAQSAAPLEIEPHQDGPFVLLMTGVNGAGKTTTIGKIAAQLTAEGRSVMIAAGDTFRAAAVEQLQTWAERAKAQFYAKNAGADAASVAYEAYNAAKEQNIDVLLVDTAGRLQNKSGLMQELQKITRVLQKTMRVSRMKRSLFSMQPQDKTPIRRSKSLKTMLMLRGLSSQSWMARPRAADRRAGRSIPAAYIRDWRG